MTEQMNAVLIHKIIKRASCLGISFGSSLVMYIDIEFAMKYFDLDLQAWFESDDPSFSADFIGIQQHINRSKGLFDQGFVPRFARQKRG